MCTFVMMGLVVSLSLIACLTVYKYTVYNENDWKLDN